ncbi:MAG: tryptophan--tRNA ligase [Patescibacteria group bacterium]|nr:tryptophan--tRNA ligase [Patescibacteria group bacterium]
MENNQKKRSLSGIRSSGIIHIGNYLGAIKQWVENQNGHNSIYFLADLHAITTPIEPKRLKQNIYESLALYLACGLNPKKSIIFLQSQIPEHTQLAWILNTITYMGELQRMTQYKEKTQNSNVKSQNLGLFNYPVLMAADILLYKPDFVPVGEDQKQHVELTCALAKRFNNKFGETFKIPEVKINKQSARIMGLDDPTKKMSKSAASFYNYIALTDSPELIRKKIAKAVTDSGKDIKFDEKRAGLFNLLTIYQSLSGLRTPLIEKRFTGKGYGDFKKDLAELIIDKFAPIKEKYNKLIQDKKYLDDVLKDGKSKAQKIASQTLKEANNKVGLI